MDWMKVFRTAETSGATSSVWLWLILVFAIFIKSSSAGQINITAVSGKNATLPCRVLDGNKTINGLEWSKPELETEYVFMYRDSKPDQTKQHESFKNRADLQDRQMKDGDVSLILNNVTTADAGIYEIRISPRTKRRKRANLGGDPICIINLSVIVPPDQKNISATVGESVTLPCRPPDNSIRALVWSRPDLEPKYVLLYRDKQIDPEEQHPNFKNRVDLQDGQMKDGNVSLLLKDVTTTDSGTYECRVIQMGATRSNTDPISIISLSVVDPPGLPTGLRIGLLMAVVLLLFAIAGVIFYRRKQNDPSKLKESNSSSSPSLDSLDTSLLS